LLIGALMVIPVVTAMQLRQSFLKTILASIFFSFIAVIAGLFLSYYINLAAGGTIVVISLLLFAVTALMTSKK